MDEDIIMLFLLSSNSEGVELALRLCCAGPWHKLGTRYAQALVDHKTVTQQFRLYVLPLRVMVAVHSLLVLFPHRSMGHIYVVSNSCNLHFHTVSQLLNYVIIL